MLSKGLVNQKFQGAYPRKIGQFDADVLKPHAYEGHMVIGEKGGGKSALGEAMAIELYRRGVVIFDAIDANDLEAMFYAIPRHPGGQYYPILLIHPPTYDIHIPDGWGHIRPMCSDKGLLKIFQTAKQEKRIISMACMLWPKGTVGKILADWFFSLPAVQRKFKHHVFIFMREIGHYAFSQLRIFKEVEARFREAATWVMKEGRHHRITFFFDLQRAVDLYKGIRTLVDHTHIKKSGKSMIPGELSWVLPAIDEARDTFAPENWQIRGHLFPYIQKLWKSRYYSLDRSEEINPVNKFQMAPFRHKDPTDDFEDITGIRFVRNAVKEEGGVMTAEEYEVLLGAKFRIESNWSWAQINRTLNLLGTPVSTQKGRIQKYIEKGELIIRQ